LTAPCPYSTLVLGRVLSARLSGEVSFGTVSGWTNPPGYREAVLTTVLQTRLPFDDESLPGRSDSPHRIAELFERKEVSLSGWTDISSLITARPLSAERKSRLPFGEALAAGKNTYVYDAHTYHTKVPPAAIKPLIEHYSNPGDLVLDPFCGSGMTGIAARQANRNVVLSDLSPAAAFLAYNFLTPVDYREYWSAIGTILRRARQTGIELELYGTQCRKCGQAVPMEYMVWSCGLICDGCGHEFVLWDVARQESARSVRESKILTAFSCPNCDKKLHKACLQRTELRPVQVGYYCCGSRQQEVMAAPSPLDLARNRSVDRSFANIPYWYPRDPLPLGFNTRQPILHGIDSVDKMYTRRNLWAMAYLWEECLRVLNPILASKALFTHTSLYKRVTRLSEFRFWGGSGNTANLNVPMIMNEQNVFRTFERKGKTIRYHLETCGDFSGDYRVSCASATDLSALPSASVDYVFTDPPFGANINYSEMNFLWEAWLGRYTDTTQEAVINKARGRDIDDYRSLMTQSFAEIHRVLRPGSACSIAFHNSSGEVWRAIQTALADGGLNVRSSNVIDKKHGTFKQFVSENAVGCDVVLHCEKERAEAKTVARAPPSRLAARDFVARIISDLGGESFRIRFQHVRREDEFDFRRLYSMWVQECIRNHHPVSLGFDQFRQEAVTALEVSPVTNSRHAEWLR
jgi:DNA modification methylase